MNHIMFLSRLTDFVVTILTSFAVVGVMAALAVAQTPPPLVDYIDGRPIEEPVFGDGGGAGNVDLASGSVQVNSPGLSIGTPGAGGLA